MEFYIKGIGIVEQAEIKLDGMTVIAGGNNSGKSTVGKSLYAAINATEDLSAKQEIDRKMAVYMRVRGITGKFGELLDAYTRFIWNRDQIENYEANIVEQVVTLYPSITQRQESLKYAINVLVQLKESISNNSFLEIALRDIKKVKELSGDEEEKLRKEWERNYDEALELCEKAEDFVKAEQTKSDFALMLMDKTLTTEFLDQIQFAYSNTDENARMRLQSENKQFFDIYIARNHIDFDHSQFIENYFDNVYFVDDPFVVEDRSLRAMRPNISGRRMESYVASLITNHRDKMRNFMYETESEREISEILYDKERFIKIFEKIDDIVPGVIEGGIYRNQGVKLKAGNLATGSKVFSVIKKLLSEGKISSKTLLILDEPESHLHPSWINKLAEIIVLLVRECEIKVLLTTHSPNFLLAVDAYMREYQIQEKCHFYQTETMENDIRVKYVERTNHLDEVYADFGRSFSEMNALRKRYMDVEEEDGE